VGISIRRRKLRSVGVPDFPLGEVRVAVPDAFFKIVVRDTGQAVEALAFLVPMYGDANHARSSGDVRPYLTSIDVFAGGEPR